MTAPFDAVLAIDPADVSGVLQYPMQLKSEANTPGHWKGKWRRSKEQRGIAALHAASFKRAGFKPPLTITLTRIAPRKLDTDNLARAFKATRDGVADALGVDDGDERITWTYKQERGRPKEHAVRIEVTR